MAVQHLQEQSKDMIQQIRTFYGRTHGLHGSKKTTVNEGIAWLCLKCGKVFTNKRLSEIHNCIREIPIARYDNV
jgi:hypothetical protein